MSPHNSRHLRKSFVIPFPQNSELRLQHFFYFGYLLLLTPFKIVNEKQKITIKISRIRQIISVLRILSVLMDVLVVGRFVTPTGIPGPMKFFTTFFGFGSYFVTIWYIIVLNLPRTRKLILELMNLVIGNREKLYQFEFGESMKTKETHKYRLILETYFHCIFLTGVTAGFLLAMLTVGLRATLRGSWNTVAEKLYPMGKVKHFRQMTWWMKLVGIWATFAQIDTNCVFTSAILAVFLAAKTLEDISKFFVDAIEKSKMYCFITDDDITLNFRRVRRAFFIVSGTFTQITFLILIYLAIGSCVMMVLMFTGGPEGFSIITCCLIFYYVRTMTAAANATFKLKKIIKLVQFSPQQRPGKWSLQKALMMYEIGSNSIGLCVSDVFVVTYAFIASVIISLLSNASIVLQSIDSFKQSFLATPPPGEDE